MTEKVRRTLRHILACCVPCPCQGYEPIQDVQGAPTGVSWYHGQISHREAVRRMKSVKPSPVEGTCLVYDSPDTRGEYVLLFCHRNKLYRCSIVRRFNDGKYVLGEDRPTSRAFASVEKLIHYYRNSQGKTFQVESGGRVKLGNYVRSTGL